MRVLVFTHTGAIEIIRDTYRRIYQEYLPGSAFQIAGNMESPGY